MMECKTQYAYKMARIALGLLLLAAAILKAYEVATVPVDGNGFLDARFFSIALVLFELLFALLLLSNLYPRMMWLSAACLFTVFAAVSFYKGVSGAASCGCFGRVQVNPWWTFGLDTVIVAALLNWRPSWWGERAACVPGVRMRLVSIGALFLLIGGPTTYWMATSEPARLTVTGIIEGNGNLVILEPEKWVGQPLPIRSHIDIGDQLATGRWTLLLFHHDCPKCREVMPKYEQVARMRNTPNLSQNASSTPAAPSSRGAPVGVRIAFVEVPPYGQVSHSSTASPIVTCRMSDDRDWFVQTPVEIQLVDGNVTQVSTELKFLYSSRGGGRLPGTFAEVSTLVLPYHRRVRAAIAERTGSGNQASGATLSLHAPYMKCPGQRRQICRPEQAERSSGRVGIRRSASPELRRGLLVPAY